MGFTADLADRFAVSTWSLHRALGGTYPYKPGGLDAPARQPTYGEGSVELIDLPKQFAERGIFRRRSARFIYRAARLLILRTCGMPSMKQASSCRHFWSKTAISAVPETAESAMLNGWQAGSRSLWPSAPRICV